MLRNPEAKIDYIAKTSCITTIFINNQTVANQIKDGSNNGCQLCSAYRRG